jgi:hypothetical protein
MEKFCTAGQITDENTVYAYGVSKFKDKHKH